MAGKCDFVLLVALEQDDFLVWERDFNSGVVEGFLDRFRNRIADLEPVFTLHKRTRNEVDRAVVQR